MAIKDTARDGSVALHARPAVAKDDSDIGIVSVAQEASPTAAGTVPTGIAGSAVDDPLAGRFVGDAAPDSATDALGPSLGEVGSGKSELADRVGSVLGDADDSAQDTGPSFGKDMISEVHATGVTPGAPVAFTNSSGEVKSVGSAASGDGMFLGVDVGAMRFEKEAAEQAAEAEASSGSGGSGGSGSGSGGGAGGGTGETGTGGLIHEQENADGSHSSVYNDGTIITTHPDGTTETSYADGTVETDHPDGTLTTEYPDGSTETIHPDGTTEETPPTDGEGQEDPDGPPPDGEGEGEGDGDGEGGDDAPTGGGDGTEAAGSTGIPDEEVVELPPGLVLFDDTAALRQHQGSQHDAGTETQPTEDDIAFGSGAITGPVPDVRAELLLGPGGGPDDLGDFGGGSGALGDVLPGNVDGNITPGPDSDTGVQTAGPEERDTTHDIDAEPPASSQDDSSSDDDGGALFGFGHLRPVDDPTEHLRDLALHMV